MSMSRVGSANERSSSDRQLAWLVMHFIRHSDVNFQEPSEAVLLGKRLLHSVLYMAINNITSQLKLTLIASSVTYRELASVEIEVNPSRAHRIQRC
jgi:hypothetical protein